MTERQPRAATLFGRLGVGLWEAIALLASAWAVLAAVVAPAMIRVIQAGRGPRFLEQHMPSRDGTQVDAYVALWYQLNRSAVACAGAL